MLSDQQKATVRAWAEEGAALGEIHARLSSELGVTMTYLEARLLVSDLQLSLDKPAEPGEETGVPGAAADSDKGLQREDPPAGGAPAAGSVHISVDDIAQPRTLVSGMVTFPDGKRAAWYVDQMGRLGIDPDEEGYRPSEEDLVAFRQQVQKSLKSHGF